MLTNPPQGFFIGGQISPLGNQKKRELQLFLKDFLGDNPANSPCLDYRFLHVATHYLVGFQKNLLLSLTCSQIWPPPLVEDHQSTYLTKLEKNVFFFWENFSIQSKINFLFSSVNWTYFSNYLKKFSKILISK
jgi:hypothetical protein